LTGNKSPLILQGAFLSVTVTFPELIAPHLTVEQKSSSFYPLPQPIPRKRGMGKMGNYGLMQSYD